MNTECAETIALTEMFAKSSILANKRTGTKTRGKCDKKLTAKMRAKALITKKRRKHRNTHRSKNKFVERANLTARTVDTALLYQKVNASTLLAQ